jgi:hypothetical protein
MELIQQGHKTEQECYFTIYGEINTSDSAVFMVGLLKICTRSSYGEFNR